MLRTITSIALLPLLVLLLASVQAFSAEYELTTDKEAFMAEYPDLMKQDFSAANVAPAATKTCPSPLNSTSSNECFVPGDILPGIQFSSGINEMENFRIYGVNVPSFGNTLISMVGNNSNQFRVRFLETVYNVVGLNIGCVTKGSDSCSDTLRVDIFTNGNVQVGSTTVEATSAFDAFLGISSSEPISFIDIRPVDEEKDTFTGVSVTYFGRANINIPTLSEWGLIAMAGVIGIAGLLYIRKRQAAA